MCFRTKAFLFSSFQFFDLTGTAPRRSYHDRQWAAKMKEIGLQPSTTGEAGGKETGQSVTHYIIPRGPCATAYAKLKARGFHLHWQSAPAGKEAKAKKARKTKFTCPECGQNAWGKPDTLLICGVCFEDSASEICLMLAEPSRESLPKPYNQIPAPPASTAPLFRLMGQVLPR
jgi:hypothetical protein